MTKATVSPKAGDALKISAWLGSRGKIVKTKSPQMTTIDAVYEDGSVRSAEGEQFRVKLEKPAKTFTQKVKGKSVTKHLVAVWVTVE